MKTLKKVLAIVLCLSMIFCFVGCGKENPNGLTDDQQAAVNSVTGTTGGFGARMKMVYPDRKYIFGKEMTIEWSGLKDGETVTLTLEKKNGSNYEKVLEKTGLTGTTYKYEKAMENADYRIKLVSVAKDGTKKEASNTKNDGFEFKNTATSTGASVNAGIDYKFQDKISLQVLNNYLNRSMTYVMSPDDQPWATGSLDPDFTYECFRGILNTGAKYINRFIADFTYSAAQEKNHADIKRWISDIHKVDPDIIFEAGIFETIGKSDAEIKVPAWVFEAFGKKAQDRTFELSAMYSSFGANKQGDGTSHIPDITKEEYQMYVYYRACTYINLGIESLHMGIVSSIGTNDTDCSAYAKVLGMIREYAKKNARRGYVLINGHGTQRFVYNGVTLFDFHASPMRLRTAKGEVDHAVSETNPQKCDFYPGEQMLYGTQYHDNDAPYLKHIKGTSPSGWTTDNYPYLLEFDNWGGKNNKANDNIGCIDRFNYDEISWFANQPDWYRREALQGFVNKLVGLKDNGHLAMPGRRTAYNHVTETQEDYWMNDATYAEKGFSDEATIKAIYAKLK